MEGTTDERPDTDEQKAAVEDNDRHVAILASAGSGKTRTLVRRVVKEVTNLEASPSALIAFTFTNRAADDLKARVHLKLFGKIDEAEFARMYVGTIHGYCNDFLRQLESFYNFDVLDDDQLESLIYRLYDEIDLDRTYGSSIVVNVRDFVKDYEIYENELLDEGDLPKEIKKPISRFADILLRNRLLTFGAMIRFTVKEIERRGGLDGLAHLFVDEFQDINPAQERLITAMTSGGAKLSIVGDDLQSIYQWRGSDVTRIIEFATRWKGDTHVLSANFRSRKDIVETADSFSESIEPRYRAKKKVMRPVLGDGGQRNVHWVHASDEGNQATLLGALVEKALKAEYAPGEIAVLLRSVKRSGPAIIRELSARNIPFYCPLISVLDESSLIVLGKTLVRLLSLPEAKNEEEEQEQDSLFKQFSGAFADLQPDEKKRESGMEVFREWCVTVQSGQASTLNIRHWLYKFLEASEISWGTQDVNLLTQMGILSRLIRSAEETNRRTLIGFGRKKPSSIYTHLAYMLENQLEEALPTDQPPREVNAVLVTTVHQAKGLEWPVVFVPSLAHMRFPVPSRSHGSSFSDDIAKRYGTSEVDERRLFYVALTRAKDHLILASFNNRGKVSPFLESDGKHPLLELTKSVGQITFQKSRQITVPSEMLIGIGITDLLMLLECPFQYSIRRVFGVYPQVGDELGYGRSMHEIIERSVNDGKWKDTKDIADVVRQHTHIPLESPRQLEIHKRSIAERVTGLAGTWTLPPLAGSEIPISFILENVEISGVVDTYVEDQGRIILLDWKTSIHEEFARRYEMQMQLYAHALRNQGKDVIGCSIIDINETYETGVLAKREIDVSKDTVSRLIESVRKELSKLQSMELSPYPSKETCRSCDVRSVCRYRVS